MTNKTESTNLSGQRLSFGVEAEFLVPWRFDDEADPDSNIPGLPPLFRIPSSMRDQIMQSKEPEKITGPLLFKSIEKTLETSGLSSQYSHTSALGKPSSALPSPPLYLNWGVEEDASVLEEGNDKYQTQLNNETFQQWIGLELQSPAEFEAQVAFDAIPYAFNITKKNYRCFINYSCSIHVHVGVGEEFMDLQMIRRVATLAYAVDPLLFTLHHPIRQVSDWCRSIRDYSDMAMGVPTAPPHTDSLLASDLCVRYLGRDVRYGEDPISWRSSNATPAAIAAFELTRQPNHFEPFQHGKSTSPPTPKAPSSTELATIQEAIASPASAVVMPYASIRKRETPRVKFPRPSPQRLGELAADLWACNIFPISSAARGKRAQGNVGVFEAARRIYEAGSSCAIAALLGTDNRNASINFEAYTCLHLQGTEPRPTIEFRVGEGGLDDWARWWARICVGLVRFAVHAPVAEFIRVLRNCDIAARQDGQYDVLDLLDDLGLFAEAEVAEQRILKKRDEWKLEFV
ncbi:hypothetical protein F4775DRAFT_603418 [Biscogniauxia sp. FL1348]|nr:hypothetical protein F4775DRAFT_603418 [Biscogniauxia sp. FL1348]